MPSVLTVTKCFDYLECGDPKRCSDEGKCRRDEADQDWWRGAALREAKSKLLLAYGDGRDGSGERVSLEALEAKALTKWLLSIGQLSVDTKDKK